MSFGKFIGFASQGAARRSLEYRSFRHVYVRTGRGISHSRDLEGKHAGIPEWAQRAAISARVPDAFNEGGGKIVRLYSDHRGKEMDHYAATGFYPIMHVVAMRRVEFERYPRVAMNLFKAFDEAKRQSLE